MALTSDAAVDTLFSDQETSQPNEIVPHLKLHRNGGHSQPAAHPHARVGHSAPTSYVQTGETHIQTLLGRADGNGARRIPTPRPALWKAMLDGRCEPKQRQTRQIVTSIQPQPSLGFHISDARPHGEHLLALKYLTLTRKVRKYLRWSGGVD